MNQVNQLEIDKYLNRVEKNLSVIYSSDEINEITKNMNLSISEYIRDHPSCTIVDVQNYLQEDELFSDWAINADLLDVNDKMNYNIIQKKGGIAVFIVSLLIVLLFLLSSHIEDMIILDGHNNLKTILINR